MPCACVTATGFLLVRGPASRPQVTLDTAKLAKRAASNFGGQAQKQLDDAKKKLLENLKLSPPKAPADSAAHAPAPNIQDALNGLLKKK